MLTFTPVVSSMVTGQCYQDDQLFVQFTNGRIYKYIGVPFAVYHELVNAQSFGQYLNRNIKPIYPAVACDLNGN